jgi:hypothetical protein
MANTSHKSTRRSGSLHRSNHSGTPRSTGHSITKKKKPSSAQTCWPGFEPTPGKAAGEKGSCRPKRGNQTESVRRADQKRAAANKLQKINPR